MSASQLAGVQHYPGHVRLRHPQLDPAAREPRVDRIIVAIHPDQRLRRHPDDLAAVHIGHRGGQRPHLLLLLDQALGRNHARRAMHPPVGLLAPRVQAVLIVEGVREHPTRLEVRTHEPVRTLQHTLRLRIPRLQDHPPDRQLPAERGKRLRRPAKRPDRGLPIPHQLLRQRPQPPKIPREAEQDVRRLLLKINVPSIARDQHTSHVTTHPRRR